jgi:hypothetical protein
MHYDSFSQLPLATQVADQRADDSVGDIFVFNTGRSDSRASCNSQRGATCVRTIDKSFGRLLTGSKLDT